MAFTHYDDCVKKGLLVQKVPASKDKASSVQ